ncbi:tyrosine-type recombinase/integrase (plasmid) [Crocosphaera watsonii WH 8501]|uniref:Phage integrase:Phage integrase, N-terminal SAM-like n=1 Tax=Crocosphaera watsonii WH 8501 TaxID=165597 RepID=Q4C0I7_CROWT|nr:tyrosine-type recombinase/integrase [Crocosphaera watsonii]EAM49669.1 Phage integrase:Phage integrase, N-terminal SAM-like [Crocosphaera watsonii WH 8501]
MLTQTTPNDLTPTDLLDNFAAFVRLDTADGNAADDTVKTYACTVKQFFSWCHVQRLHPLEATRDDIKLYRRWLVEIQDYKCATIALKLTVVRRFYAGAVERGLILANPALGIKPPRENIDPAERINYLEEPEVIGLLESLPTENTIGGLRDRFLVAVMVLEGCRTVEMHRACIGDIVKRGGDIGIRVSGKRSRRIVPLTPDLAKLLNKYLNARKRSGEVLNADTPLFIALDKRTYGGRLSRRSIQRLIDKYLRAAGLKEQPKKNKGKKPASFQEYQPSNGEQQRPSQSASSTSTKFQQPQRQLSAHSLRHTAGTLAIRAGSDLRQVQDLLGHADPRTTALYAHVADRWRNNPALRLEVKVPL